VTAQNSAALRSCQSPLGSKTLSRASADAASNVALTANNEISFRMRPPPALALYAKPPVDEKPVPHRPTYLPQQTTYTRKSSQNRRKRNNNRSPSRFRSSVPTAFLKASAIRSISRPLPC